jgi:hypothetical protein
MKTSFNTMAMVNPTKPEDLLLIIREVNSEIKSVLEHLSTAEKNCIKDKQFA